MCMFGDYKPERQARAIAITTQQLRTVAGIHQLKPSKEYWMKEGWSS